MIKKSIVLTVSFFYFLFSFGQKSDLIFYSEQGENFHVVLNGIKQNVDARSNVKIKDLTAPIYKCKIIFKNTKLGQLDKSVTTKQGFETTYVIKKNDKNKYMIRWINESSLTKTAINNSDNNNQLSTSESQSEKRTKNNSNHHDLKDADDQHISSNANIDVKISDPVNDESFSMNTKIKMNTNTNTSTQTTNIQKKKQNDNHKNENKYADNHGNKYVDDYDNKDEHRKKNTDNHGNKHNQHNQNNNQQQITNAVPGYNGPFGCNYPMSFENYASVKSSIASKSFEDSKMIIAKQVISNNCLTTNQIKGIVKLFDFETTKLDLAKFAYGYVYDKGNYYQINDVFDFESSIKDLNDYMKDLK
ncbi:MAG: DUF4476 domain-containing protein [Bacteroidales bacterium]